MSNLMHKVKDAMTDRHDRDRAPNTEGQGEIDSSLNRIMNLTRHYDDADVQ